MQVHGDNFDVRFSSAAREPGLHVRVSRSLLGGQVLGSRACRVVYRAKRRGTPGSLRVQIPLPKHIKLQK